MPFASPILRAAESGQYKSQYGPKYHYQSNFKGVTGKTLFRFGLQTAPLGIAAVAGLLVFASGLPRVRADILQKIPFIGHNFIKEVHPADSPF